MTFFLFAINALGGLLLLYIWEGATNSLQLLLSGLLLALLAVFAVVGDLWRHVRYAPVVRQHPRLRTVLVTLGGVGGVLLALLACLLGFAMAFAAGDIARGLRVEVLAGYRGWVVIQHEDPSCPPMRNLGHYAPNPLLPWRRFDLYAITIPPSGRACTSTSSQAEHGSTEIWVEYVHPDGARELLPHHPETGVGVQHGSLGGRHGIRMMRHLYFIGTREEYERHPLRPGDLYGGMSATQRSSGASKS